MATEQKEKKLPLPNLSPTKRALLMQTTQTPGWKVVVELANELCAQFTQDILKVDPEGKDSGHVVLERQRRARIASECFDQLMYAVHSHAETVIKAQRTEDEDAVESVGAMFGIHPSKKDGNPAETAIKNVFGIYPAKPSKKKLPEQGK